MNCVNCGEEIADEYYTAAATEVWKCRCAACALHMKCVLCGAEMSSAEELRLHVYLRHARYQED